MRTRSRTALILLLLLGPASLAGKLAAPSAHAPEPAGHAYRQMLAATGHEAVGRLHLLNGPAYRAEVYRRLPAGACGGQLHVVPMATNAEASALLARGGAQPVAERFFVFRGEVHDAYPTARQWLARAQAALTRLAGLPGGDTVVLGVAATATCLGARRLPWAGGPEQPGA